MTYPEKRTNPRFPNKYFAVTLRFGEDLKIPGRAASPSAYGANVEINEYHYGLLAGKTALWKDCEIKVSTDLNDLSGIVNDLKISRDGKFFLSLKLVGSHTWFN